MRYISKSHGIHMLISSFFKFPSSLIGEICALGSLKKNVWQNQPSSKPVGMEEERAIKQGKFIIEDKF